MSIAETDLAIDVQAARIQRANDERYAFYRMLTATDRVLWHLETLNLKGVRDLPAGMGQQIRDALAEVPASCLEPLVGGKVQEVLDSVFEVQERLFRWHDPSRDLADHEPAGAAPVVEPAEVAPAGRAAAVAELVTPELAPPASAIIEPPAPELPVQREWFRGWALRRAAAAGTAGVLWSELTRKCTATDRNRRASWLEELVREELLRAQPSARGWRYFAMGEGSGG